MSQTTTLVLLRHGQSIWNRQHRLTGWSDVGLSARGRAQAAAAAKALRKADLRFDVSFTSQLCRAHETLDLVCAANAWSIAEVHRLWQLNERHYGALEGLGPLRGLLKCGLRQLVSCQRRFDVMPPLLELDDPRFPGNQARYANIPRDQLPRAETMEQAMQRLVPVWDGQIWPALQSGRHVLIVAHKNILRGALKHMLGLGAKEVERLSIRTGRPWVYEFNSTMELVAQRILDIE